MVVALVLAAALVALHLGQRATEPVLGGRRLGVWLADLDRPDEQARLTAARAIAEAGPTLIPSLLRSLERQDGFLLRLFLRFEPQLPLRLWRPLYVILQPREVGDRRKLAARALGCLGPQAVPAVPSLIEALGDPYPAVPPEASAALCRIGKEAVPALTSALPRAPDATKMYLLPVLGANGPEAAPAVPVVIHILAHDPNPELRVRASGALRRVGTPALPAVLELLASPETEVRERAASFLQPMADHDAAGLRQLVALFPRQPLPVRRELLGLFRGITLSRRLAGFAVARALDDPDPDLRREAELWLRQNSSLPELEPGLGRQPEPVQRRVRELFAAPENRPAARDETHHD